MYQSIQHHIPGNRILHQHHCVNLKSSCIRQYCCLVFSNLQHSSEEHNILIMTQKYICHSLYGNIKPHTQCYGPKRVKTTVSSHNITYNIFSIYISSLGRPRCRWEDNIKMDLHEVGRGCGDWMELAQDRDRWRGLVSTVMNFGVP
jgi:hypothetical protein